MVVQHKSIYDSGNRTEDGHRLLVTRFWPRGIKKSAIDSWERNLGAPVELIKRKKAGGLTDAGLRTLYTASMDSDALERVLALTEATKVTLLCTCRDELCHRVVLAEILNRRLRRRRPRRRAAER